MKSLMYIMQVFVSHVGIHLGGRDIGMPEQRLHRAEIGAILEQVSSKAVAHDVRCDLASNAGFHRIALYQALDATRRKAQARCTFYILYIFSILNKKSVVHIFACFHVGFDCSFGSIRKKHHTDFFALSPHRELFTRHVDVVLRKTAELGHAKACRKEQLEYCFVAKTLGCARIWRPEETVELSRRNEVKRPLGNLRELNALR